MKSLAILLGRLSRLLNRAALWLAATAVLVMTAAATWQVIARYLLDSPPIWTEEVARYAMVWAGLLGASTAFYAGVDPTLFPDVKKVSGTFGKGLALLRAGGVLLFVSPILYYCLLGSNYRVSRGYMARSLERVTETMEIPLIFISAAIPIAFGLVVIHLMAQLLARFCDHHKEVQ